MIDFHCHLDLYPDPKAAVRQADAARVYVLSVTTTPKAWRGTSALAKGCSRIRTALGFHPQLAHERHRELALFEGLLPETRYVGEVGLDGTPEFRDHAAVQRRVFETVLRMSALQGGRILSIHSRRACDEVLDFLRQQPDAGTPILHWFSGSKAQLMRAADQGCWFSVGPPMTRSATGRALLRHLPRDRVLTETDGPFTQESGRPLIPEDTGAMAAALADVWGISEATAIDQLLANLRRLSGPEAIVG
ncbi:Qat anti-phage system TatD family nuclease QatD [Methylobacterium radiotolerans]|uniref:TatD-related deoxyribonuclease n=1 Tax=Methylobacterium radiotolerans (strain ATCC 27329 / DSM 1819 / JCM 2831 / NBRC 15690 / NCIMB 10815 / 0-1) TaxID=426355 RepID=B1M992_METRJ|nr:Qat anti-phage system TatD family nuclease QatD [Methylobacterium radiotolerans]ACB28067.1 TatD-related deoxyribonuclease [Methylobacterium radiotolerans JCM 2831]GEN00977.1 TatD family hydrolase [Methylobacterium radiotolerans]